MIERMLPVLGIRTRFETNSRAVLDAVDESFGAWRDAPEHSPAHLRVTIMTHGGGGTGGRAPILHRFPDATRVLVQSPDCMGVTDPLRCGASAYVRETLVADRAHFRDGVLDALTFALVAQFDRHPLHAAAVSSDSRAVLLCGPSGVGKSTLAYAAHRDGLTVLSEDIAWMQLDPDLRVWGSPRAARLKSEASNRFPEIRTAATPSARPSDDKLLVPLHRRGDSRFVAEPVAVCVLEPGHATATLEPIGAASVAEALGAEVAPGFNRFPARHDRIAHALSRNGGWRLRLSGDAREAIPLVRELLAG